MRAACMLLGAYVIAGAGCLSLGVADPSTGGAGGMGGADSSSSVSSGSGGNGGSGAGCVSNSPCTTGKSGVCADGFLSCDAPQMCIQSLQPSAEKCDTTADESCDGSGDCSGKTTFSESYGAISAQAGRDVAVDSQGNVLVTGFFAGSMDLGGGTLTSMGDDDIFVAKFDPAGNHIWSRRFGDSDTQKALAIAVDADDNVFIGGELRGTVTFGSDTFNTSGNDGDAFIAKMDANGNPLWAKCALADGPQSFEDIAVDATGDVIGVGHIYWQANFGAGVVTGTGEDDILVAKFAKNDGTNVWARAFGQPLRVEWGAGVATDSTGAIYVTGPTMSALNFGDGATIANAGKEDAFLVKLNPQGDAVWAKGFGNGNYQEGVDVATDNANNVILSIKFEGTVSMGGGILTAANGITDSAVAKFDSTGQHLWSTQFKHTADSNGLLIDIDSAGNILATGTFQGSMDFGTGPLQAMGTDMAFAKLDPMGKAIYAYRYGSGSTKVTPLGITAGHVGNAWIVGTFTGNVDFGRGILSSGTYDMFLAGFTP